MILVYEVYVKLMDTRSIRMLFGALRAAVYMFLFGAHTHDD